MAHKSFPIYLFSDDTLLDEDLEGDEEYDLGNDEEEALLADDYEIERVSILFAHYFSVGWNLTPIHYSINFGRVPVESMDFLSKN